MAEDPFRLSLSSFKDLDDNQFTVQPSDIRNTSLIAVVEGINIFQDKSNFTLQLTNRSQASAHERGLQYLEAKPSYFRSVRNNPPDNLQERDFIPPQRLSHGISPHYRQIAAKDESRKSIYELPRQNKAQFTSTDSTEENQIICDATKLKSKRTANNSVNRNTETYSSVHRHTETQGSQYTSLHARPSVKLQNLDNEHFRKSNGDQAPLESTTRNEEMREAEEFLNNVATAQPNSVIYLPKTTLKIGTLFVNKPLKFVGNPEARLEINEAIIIDLSNYPSADEKVLFSECNIHFKFMRNANKTSAFLSTRSINLFLCVFPYLPSFCKGTKDSEEVGCFQKKHDSATFSEAHAHDSLFEVSCVETHHHETQGLFPLFSIGSATTVELSDCEIRSMNFEKELGFDVPYLNDIAFLLKHSKNSQGRVGSNLILNNCRISNFLTAVQNTFMCSLSIEKCSFIENRGHTINLSNPESFTLNECIIEKSGKSCVNIRFSKEVPTRALRKIAIEKNEFIKSNSYGVSIFGENMIYQACPILIHSNLMISPMKDGIGIKNLNIQQISIFKNTINGSNANGIFLQNIINGKCANQIELRENKIVRSSLYGLALIDAAVDSDSDEFIENDKGGVIISGSEEIKTLEEYCQYKASPLMCKFTQAQLKKNKDSGLIIVGYLKGNIVLESCQIHENLNGIYIRLKQLANFTTMKAGSASRVESCSLGHILLDKTNVFQNKDSGISLRAIHEKLRFRETLIQENQTYAIFLAEEQNKNYLVLEKGKFKNFINGFVGGEWGLVDGQSDRVCKGAKCNVF